MSIEDAFGTAGVQTVSAQGSRAFTVLNFGTIELHNKNAIMHAKLKKNCNLLILIV